MKPRMMSYDEVQALNCLVFEAETSANRLFQETNRLEAAAIVFVMQLAIEAGYNAAFMRDIERTLMEKVK